MDKFLVAGLGQAVLCLTLIFGVLTILPRGLALIKGGRRARGVLYIFIALAFVFFLALSASYAVQSFRDSSFFGH